MVLWYWPKGGRSALFLPQAPIQDFGQGWQQSFDPKGAWAQNLVKIGVLHLQLPENCMILEILGAGGRAPRPPWIHYCPVWKFNQTQWGIPSHPVPDQEVVICTSLSHFWKHENFVFNVVIKKVYWSIITKQISYKAMTQTQAWISCRLIACDSCLVHKCIWSARSFRLILTLDQPNELTRKKKWNNTTLLPCLRASETAPRLPWYIQNFETNTNKIVRLCPNTLTLDSLILDFIRSVFKTPFQSPQCCSACLIVTFLNSVILRIKRDPPVGGLHAIPTGRSNSSCQHTKTHILLLFPQHPSFLCVPADFLLVASLSGPGTVVISSLDCLFQSNLNLWQIIFKISKQNKATFSTDARNTIFFGQNPYTQL